MELWNNEEPVASFGIDVPKWIDYRDISPNDIAAICQGGCASGAYMPAVTYYQARETMNEHGDAVLDYIESNLGELPDPPKDISWSQLACFYLSYAVELWAGDASQQLEDIDDDEDEDAA